MMCNDMRKSATLAAVLTLMIGAAGAHAQTDSQAHSPASAGEGGLGIPPGMEAEHEEIHAHLAELTAAGGRTGEAARELAEVLDPHFQRENEIALPPLGLLGPLARGEFDCEMTAVLELTDKLDAEMPKMLSEHEAVAAAVNELNEAASSEGNAPGVAFAEMLSAHAHTEEEITYPAALLVGRYVKAKATEQCG